MIAGALPADLLDRIDLAVDQDAEPADVDQFLDALDRLVERRLSQRNQNETGGPAMAGNTKLYDNAALARIRYELNVLDARQGRKGGRS